MSGGPVRLTISRVFDAPPSLVYEAFTDPDHLAVWWGPDDSSISRDEVDVDLRPGGHLRWITTSASDPGVRVQVCIDLSDVIPEELLAGAMHIGGRLPLDFDAHRTTFRFEFHQEPEGRTRLELRQWLSADLESPTTAGWLEALRKLDTLLASRDGHIGDRVEV